MRKDRIEVEGTLVLQKERGEVYVFFETTNTVTLLGTFHRRQFIPSTRMRSANALYNHIQQNSTTVDLSSLVKGRVK